MFTGIVVTTGILFERRSIEDDLSIAVEAAIDIGTACPGESVSVGGVCLTIIRVEGSRLWFDVSSETLGCTRLGELVKGNKINLEPAMPASGRYGGHLVSGHIDGLGSLEKRKESARSVTMVFSCSNALSPYVAKKGSICLDGVSLTVNQVIDDGDRFRFEVNIIPHTLLETTLGNLEIGHQVHIEVDQLARYVERIMTCNKG